MTCPRCGAELSPGDAWCSRCDATRAPARGDATHSQPQPAPDSAEITQDRPAPTGLLAAGALLGGRYRIEGLLGRGGMGEVYRAADQKLGEVVALKLLPEGARDPVRLRLFMGEVRVARQVTHPNVCRVHDVADADGLEFMTMVVRPRRVYTARSLTRSLDLLHVSASHLALCTTFVSADDRQFAIAKGTGLKVVDVKSRPRGRRARSWPATAPAGDQARDARETPLSGRSASRRS